MKNAYIQLLLLVFIAAGTIFYKYFSVPANLAWDELEFARLALSLQHEDYQVYSPLATGHATLYFYILSGFLNLFGTELWVLRLPAAFFGIANVLLFYFILRNIFKNSLYAFAGAALLASTRWYVTFARYSFEATFLLFLELCAVLLLLTWFKSKQRYILWISSFFTGLAFHSYTPGRIFALVPAVQLIIHRQWKELAGFLAITALVALPLVVYLGAMPDTRIQQVSVFTQAQSPLQAIQFIGTNSAKTMGMFLWEGDGNGRHNFPFKQALNGIQLLLASVGFILMIIHKKDRQNSLFLTWAVISIVPPLFTIPAENPNMLRTVTLLPAIIYAIILTVERIILFTPKKQLEVVVIVITLFLISSQLYDLRTYFQFQSRVSRNAFEITCPLAKSLTFPAKKLGDIPKECRVTSNMF